MSFRKCVCRVLNVHPRTRSAMLPLVMRKFDIMTQLQIRFCKFFHACTCSRNSVVQQCVEVCKSSQSNVAENVRICMSQIARPNDNLFNIHFNLNEFIEARKELIRNSESAEMGANASVLRELLDAREGAIDLPLDQHEIVSLIFSFI